MKRPLGVTILAILCFVGGVTGLVHTGPLALYQWQRYRSGMPIGVADEPLWRAITLHPITTLVVFLALVVFYLRLGWGLWKLEDSARIGLVIYVALNLMMLAGMEVLIYGSAPDSMQSDFDQWLPKIVGIAVTLLITTYLFLPTTKRAFTKSL